MKKSRLLLLTLAFFGVSANVTFADTAAQLRTQITNFNHGGSGTLTAGGTGNTVTVTGTVSGATNYLGLNINSDVTVNWQANYSGTYNEVLIRVSGTGTFRVNSSTAKIQNLQPTTGISLITASECTIIISSGTVTTSTGIAILVQANGATLNITGGTVSATGNGGRAIESRGTLSISGGTVSATTGTAVNNAGSGTASISGGTISATTGIAIRNNSNGTINVSGSSTIVQATSTANNGEGIFNYGTGTINISGGTVSSTSWLAINNYTTGKINISGGTVTSGITSTTYSTVYAHNTGTATTVRIEISGGTIKNTGVNGFAVKNFSAGEVIIRGGTVEATAANGIGAVNHAGGTLTIRGTNTIVRATANGGNAVLNWGNGIANISAGTISSTTGAAVRNNAAGTINVSGSNTIVQATGANGSGIYNIGTGAINISNGTVRSTSHIAVDNGSTGKVTISGGMVTSGITNTAYATVYAHNTGTAATVRIEITGGTVKNTGAGGFAVKNISAGEVIIRGGTVEATAENGVAAVNHAGGTLTIRGANTIVQATAANGRAVYNYGNGPVNISAGTISALDHIAVDNSFNGKVTISGGTITSGSISASYSTVFLFDQGTQTATRLEITGGTIKNTASGNVIRNNSTGAVVISGGTVQANTGTAIWNHNTGTITISGNVTVTSASASATYGTIFLANTGESTANRLSITNANVKVENTAGGTAIRNNSTGAIAISGGTVSATNGAAIFNNNSGTINITGTATVTSAHTSGTSATIFLANAGTATAYRLTITGNNVKVENTAAGGTAIRNNSTGGVSIYSGEVSATTGNAIYNNHTGQVYIGGGTVKVTGAGGSAITNASSRAINIAGGKVLAKDGYAVSKTGSGAISIYANGIVFAYGSTDTDIINGDYNLSDRAIIAAWNSAAGTNTYEESSSADIFKLPASASAAWGKQGTVNGITVFNGTNANFIPIEGVAVVPPQPFEGLGTNLNPYLISTPQQLKQLSDLVNVGNVNFNNKYYKLMNDIDLSDYQEGEGWRPIGDYNYANENIRFKGHFDGNQKKITGLKIRNTTFLYVGLFGYVENGTIKNFCIENADILSSADLVFPNYIGCVAGGISNGTISNCYSTGSVSKTGVGTCIVGGIVGSSDNSAISNCYSTASVSAFSSEGNSANPSSYAGGIAGDIRNNTTISNCYSTGVVNAVASFYSDAGGVTGAMVSSSKITDCAALNPSIYRSDAHYKYCGRVVGVKVSSDCTLLRNTGFEDMINPDNYTTWDDKGHDKIDGEDISIQMIHEDGTLGNRFTLPNWTTQNGKLPGLFGNTVEMPFHLVGGIPFEGDGTEVHPYEIRKHEDLNFLAGWINKGNGNDTKNVFYILMNDLDLTSYSNWQPIGRQISESDFTRAFQGNFNGNGKVIRNVTINRPEDYVGLFGFVYGANIENLGVENCNITGKDHVGGLAGRFGFNSSVSNCYATGIVNGATSIGGLAGTNSESNIKNCYSTATVNGNAPFLGFTGGLVGLNTLSSEISNCYATGDVLGNKDRVGGLAGYNDGTSKILNSIAANYSVITTMNTTQINRITGFNEGVLLFNYANQDMEVKANGVDININNGTTTTSGEDKTMLELESSNFYLTGANWLNSQRWNILPPDGVWKKCIDDGLPYLRWQGGDCEELVSIEQLQITNYELRVFPNPTDGQLRITNYELKEIGEIEIYDVAGRVVFTSSLSLLSLETALDITHLPAGVYFLRAGNEMVKVVKK